MAIGWVRTIKAGSLVLGMSLLLGLSGTPAESAALEADDGQCRITLGFASIRELIKQAEGSDKVGDCLEDASYDAWGDATQRTTNGLLVWHQSNTWTGFTDGYYTWVNGPLGMEKRLNDERLPGEVGPKAPSLVSYLYVMGAGFGTLAPKDGSTDTLVLTLVNYSPDVVH